MLDPGAKLIACGELGWTDWDATVIEGLAGLVDYHSIHIYTGSEDYWTNVLQPHQAERAISAASALIDRTAYKRGLASKPAIAYDEWNVWYRVMTVDLAERYTHSDALAVATYLNIFLRNASRVRMANLAQMVNAIAPIIATPEGATVQPIYYPFLLHARAALDVAADVHVDGDTVSPDLPAGASRWPHQIADLGPFTLLDAAASVTGHMDRVAVTLVNRSPSAEAARIVLRDFSFDGPATVTTMTAQTPVAEGTETPTGGTLALTLPPQSFTVVEARIGPERLAKRETKECPL
jgi:alpha-N-arabinofuranosidase